MKIYLHSLSFCRQNLQLQHLGSLANMAAQKLQKHTLITNGLDNTGAHAEAEAMMWTVEQLRRRDNFPPTNFFLLLSLSLPLARSYNAITTAAAAAVRLGK